MSGTGVKVDQALREEIYDAAKCVWADAFGADFLAKAIVTWISDAGDDSDLGPRVAAMREAFKSRAGAGCAVRFDLDDFLTDMDATYNFLTGGDQCFDWSRVCAAEIERLERVIPLMRDLGDIAIQQRHLDVLTKVATSERQRS